MNLRNVKLVYAREMRDQLRDRRTLFLIAVLPLLLYPLLGMSFFQLSQFLRNNASKVLVLGEEQLAESHWLPDLLHEDRFVSSWFVSVDDSKSLQVIRPDELWKDEEIPQGKRLLEASRQAIEQGDVQVVLYFPPGFGERLEEVRSALMNRSANDEVADEAKVPEPEIFYNSANEKSRIAQLRVDAVMRDWRVAVTQTNLRDSHVPLDATNPFQVRQQDVAREQQRSAATLLPARAPLRRAGTQRAGPTSLRSPVSAALHRNVVAPRQRPHWQWQRQVPQWRWPVSSKSSSAMLISSRQMQLVWTPNPAKPQKHEWALECS